MHPKTAEAIYQAALRQVPQQRAAEVAKRKADQRRKKELALFYALVHQQFEKAA